MLEERWPPSGIYFSCKLRTGLISFISSENGIASSAKADLDIRFSYLPREQFSSSHGGVYTSINVFLKSNANRHGDEKANS